MIDSLALTAILWGLSIGMLLMGFLQYAVSLANKWNRKYQRIPRMPANDALRFLLKWVLLPDFLCRRWGNQAMVQLLLQSGLDLDGREFASLRWLSTWTGVTAAVVVLNLQKPDLLGLFLATILVLFGFTGPRIWLALRIERRRSQVNLVLPDVLDRLSQGLNAGLSFESAFSRTANSFTDSFGAELRQVVQEWQFGHTRSNALRSLADRYPADSLASFIAAVNQADDLGTSLSETLRTQSKLIRSQRRRRAQEASRRLPILIAFPLVLFFLPALLIIYLVPPLLTLFFGL